MNRAQRRRAARTIAGRDLAGRRTVARALRSGLEVAQAPPEPPMRPGVNRRPSGLLAVVGRALEARGRGRP